MTLGKLERPLRSHYALYTAQNARLSGPKTKIMNDE